MDFLDVSVQEAFFAIFWNLPKKGGVGSEPSPTSRGGSGPASPYHLDCMHVSTESELRARPLCAGDNPNRHHLCLGPKEAPWTPQAAMGLALSGATFHLTKPNL